MCGIAGLIHRKGSSNVGQEMTSMLQALKHRGPDSTGFAIYGEPEENTFVLRFKVAEQEDLHGALKIHEEIKRRKDAVDETLKTLGVK
ncbi:MAG: glutamine amidotransferase, partial [Pseudomonadota bacterium]